MPHARQEGIVDSQEKCPPALPSGSLRTNRGWRVAPCRTVMRHGWRMSSPHGRVYGVSCAGLPAILPHAQQGRRRWHSSLSPLTMPVHRKKRPPALPSGSRRTLRRMAGRPVQDRHAPWMAHVEPHGRVHGVSCAGLPAILPHAQQRRRRWHSSLSPLTMPVRRKKVAVGSTARFAPNPPEDGGQPRAGPSCAMDGACRAPMDGFTACPARGCPPSSLTRNKDAAVGFSAFRL